MDSLGKRWRIWTSWYLQYWFVIMLYLLFHHGYFKWSSSPFLDEFQYRFLVDGVWRCDEQQYLIPDEHGMVNNVLYVEEPNVLTPVPHYDPYISGTMHVEDGLPLRIVKPYWTFYSFFSSFLLFHVLSVNPWIGFWYPKLIRRHHNTCLRGHWCLFQMQRHRLPADGFPISCHIKLFMTFFLSQARWIIFVLHGCFFL